MTDAATPEPGAGRGAQAGGWDCHVHVFEAAAPARAGHYRPVDRPLAQIEAVAASQGVRHLVLVQPSVYGSDNGLLLRALAVQPGRHRGVVVLGGETPADEDLDAMHAAGVRGVRLNLVSPVGEQDPPARRFDALAPALRRRGWHVQWYAPAQRLADVAALHRGSGIPCVLDHLAGFGARVAAGDPAWRAAEALAADGAWVKLSGWYRLDAQAPYAELRPAVRRLAALFGEQVVWGSDWPHTLFAPEALPAYDSTWQPVADALGDGPAVALRARTPAIYR